MVFFLPLGESGLEPPLRVELHPLLKALGVEVSIVVVVLRAAECFCPNDYSSSDKTL
jgi:hypothetical protein